MRSLMKTRRLRADPAPSRLAYRLERWLLTPSFRLFLRAGLPFCATVAAGVWYLADETRWQQIADTVAEARAAIETRPEFMVNLVSVEGASPEVAADIRDILQLELPVSSFDLNLDAEREKIATLDPVKDVAVRIRPGGVLEVHVTERIPAVLWRTYDRLTLIDATGAHVSEAATRLGRPDLPLIAGEGAEDHVTEALDLMRAARPLGDRMRGLVRIGARRWDVVLDRDQRILLPETNALQALERVIALDQAQDLLARDVVRVDMRLGQRPTVQMNEAATQAWWDIKTQTKALILDKTGQ